MKQLLSCILQLNMRNEWIKYRKYIGKVYKIIKKNNGSMTFKVAKNKFQLKQELIDLKLIKTN